MAAAEYILTFCKEALERPESKQYQTMKDTLKDHSLREGLDIVGVTDDMPGFARWELGRVFEMMDNESVTELLTAMLRFGFSNDRPIILSWAPRKGSCMVHAHLAGGQLFIDLATPMMDESDLPAMFSGHSGSNRLVTV